ncbi:hypothetical protein Tco_1523897 [Tanacetum coccineum]
MVPPNNLGPDLSGKAVNETQYRGMIGSLIYLTTSRPDIQFLTCLCARYPANPKEYHLIAAKRNFRKSTSADVVANKLFGMKSQLTDYDIIYEKTKEKIVPYPRFISLLLEHMMPEYDKDELTINPTQVFSVHNCTLKPNQPEEPPFTTHMKAICKLDVHVVSKAPKPSSQAEETEASKSKIGQSETKTKSSSAKDKSPSHPSPPTLVVGEIHKEAQQAASGLTSLEATSEEGAH